MSNLPEARCRDCLETLTMVLHRRTCPWCGSKDIWPEGTLVYQLLEVRVAAQPLVDETKRQVRKAAQNLGRAIRAWRERR